ncbi:MAG: TfoX/Sxy family protein [Candidatus Aminicenantes bacterium]|nr:TfoX/Sxy family protein [Candidatus Aminicenantes bacterium]MCK5004971.1 TfoX/Sxy family protein [Candidatus Aminicenantes bacterium]
MGSSLNFVEFVADQMEGAGEITYKMMFGEYGLYCEGKIVALVCDDQFFVKPTEAGRKFIKDPVEAPPYPGAKNYFLIEEQVENRDWVSMLIKVSAEELPLPKPKKKKPKKKK